MPEEFTVGDLKRHLQGFDDDSKLTFGGGLSFYRIKRYDAEAFLEFSEPQGYLSDAFKRRNPDVKCVFINLDNVAWDDSGIVGGPVDINVR